MRLQLILQHVLFAPYSFCRVQASSFWVGNLILHQTSFLQDVERILKSRGLHQFPNILHYNNRIFIINVNILIAQN